MSAALVAWPRRVGGAGVSLTAALVASLGSGCGEDPPPPAPAPAPVVAPAPEPAPEPDDVLAEAPRFEPVMGVLDRQPWLVCRVAIVDDLPGALECEGDLVDWAGPCRPLGAADLGPGEEDEPIYGCGTVPDTCAEDEAGHPAVAVVSAGRVFVVGEDPSDEPNCGTRFEVRAAAAEGERATLAIDGANHWGRWDAVYAWSESGLEQTDVRRSLRR